ncbi:MAG: TetR/AcrR family transcriptional regulator [Syntrophaceae bacterium]|nr:TetR/AcrR family transcriptional regulator [Syntrophaceae bacterium]
MGFEERRQREKDSRRNSILKAARRLFLEKGFRNVTVESIARKAEFSKGSIYLYFSGKEEIYTHILLMEIGKFRTKIDATFDEGGEASAILRKTADLYVDFFLTEPELFRILMTFMLHSDQREQSSDLNDRLIRTTNEAADGIERIFRYGIERGEFRPDIRLRTIRNAVWGLLNGAISLHLYTGPEFGRRERILTTVHSMLGFFIEGLKR